MQISEQTRQKLNIPVGLFRMGRLLAHRALSAVGVPGLFGPELAQMRRIGPPVLREPSGTPARRVLFVIPRAWNTHALFQTALAQALTLRNAKCAIVTCGGVMPICEFGWAEKDFYPPCSGCLTYVKDLAGLAGIELINIAEHADNAAIQKATSELKGLSVERMEDYRFGDFPIGKYAIPSVRWRLRTSQHELHPHCPVMLSGFIRGGVAWATGMKSICDRFNPDVVVMLNGLFMEERMAWAVAKAQKRRCVFFERGRDAASVFLSHEVPGPRYDISSKWSEISATPLAGPERESIRAAMDRRRRGEKVVEKYWDSTSTDLNAIRTQLKVDSKGPVGVLYTNVSWDTAMQDRDTLFTGMFDWLTRVLNLFGKRPEWTLIIRVHPAETQLPGRESYDRVEDWLRKHYNPLPANVRVVRPNQSVDSYALMNLATVGLVYASTVGLEMAVSGIPVVVAGAAHYSNKGFTYDPPSLEQYDAQITDLMQGTRSLDKDEQVDMAERYAHLFFLRRTLPMTVLDEPTSGFPRALYTTVEDLKPGKQKVLDIFASGILNGSEFCL